MQTVYPLDKIDQMILVQLLRNARISFTDLAKECGISSTTANIRIKKMEEAGIISGSQFLVQPQALGFDVCAFIGIQLAEAKLYHKVLEYLEDIHEVVECHFVTGGYSLLLKVYCTNNDHLMTLIMNRIQQIPGVTNTNTFISLHHAFARQVDVLNESLSIVENTNSDDL